MVLKAALFIHIGLIELSGVIAVGWVDGPRVGRLSPLWGINFNFNFNFNIGYLNYCLFTLMLLPN